MNDRRRPFTSSTVATALISSLLLGSCASVPTASNESMSGAAPMRAEEMQAADSTTAQSAPAAETMPVAQPQLIKVAELVVSVDTVDDAVDRAIAIVEQHQGDVLNLQNQTPQNTRDRHQATARLRVPQDQLDEVLKQLGELGIVQRQALTAEDVSNQLVDTQARLRNLRKTEEMLLDIMERSGNIADVLKVAQELSNVRSSIEQLDAQFKNLQNRVAYSEINLTISAAIASRPPQPITSTELENSWQEATYSLKEFTVNLMQIGIWLLVYSPYWLTLVGLAAFGYWKMKQSRQSTTEAEQ